MLPHAGNIFYVYALIGADGMPFYIGKGKNRRWLDHEKQCALSDGSHRSHMIRKTIAALGHLPKTKIAEGLSEVDAHLLEITLIACFGRRPSGLLTNKTDGGEGVVDTTGEIGRKISAAKMGHVVGAETRAKMRTAKLGMKRDPAAVAKTTAANRGRKHPPEMGAKIAASKRGIPRSPETIEKMRAARKGIPRDPDHVARSAAGHRGQKRSPETKARMAAARRAWWDRHRATG